MDQILFASYLLSLSAITINLVRAKLQDDFETELKEHREYDLSYEKIDSDRINPQKKYIVLAKHKGRSKGAEKAETEGEK